MSGSPSNDRLQSLQRSISQYLAQTDFDVGDQGEIDRIERRLASNPEKFITPNPGVPYQEDLSGNWNRIKNEFGLTPKRELEQQLQDYDDRVRDFLLDSVREVIDDVGVFAVANYVYGGVPTGNESVEQTIDDILDEASPDVFRAEIDNRLGNIEQEVPGGLGFERDDQAAEETLTKLNRITDQTYSDLDRAIDNIESQLQAAESDARRRILTRFENAFGQRFDDVDDAVNSLRDQFTQLQNLDIETVEASFLGGDETPGISLPPGFGDLEDELRERVEPVINLEATADALPSRRRERPFADVRIREGTIERVDFGKAVTDQAIVVREDADLAEAADPALSETGQAEVEIAVPDPEPDEDEEDDEPAEPPQDEPEPDEIDEDALRNLEGALGFIEGDFGLGGAVENIGDEQINPIIDAIEDNRLPPQRVQTLRDVLEDTDPAARRNAVQQNETWRSLFEAVGLTVMTPDEDDDESPFFEREEPGEGTTDDLDQDDVARRRGEAPDRGLSREDIRDEIRDVAAGAAQGQNIRTQPNSDRPDPNQNKADKRLESFFGGNLMKAQQWVAAEQRRLKPRQRGQQPLPPAEFWDEFGSNIWASLTKPEFVNLTVDGFQ